MVSDYLHHNLMSESLKANLCEAKLTDRLVADDHFECFMSGFNHSYQTSLVQTIQTLKITHGSHFFKLYFKLII